MARAGRERVEQFGGGADRLTVETGGGSLLLRVTGRGRPVLLLHGIPANGELWRHVAPRLAGGNQVLVPDLLGYGGSIRRPGARVDVAAQAAYLMEALPSVVGDQQFAVVGTDIGGAVAQIIATERTDRVASLMLVNSVAYDSWPVPAMRVAQRLLPLLRRLPPRALVAVLRRAVRRELRQNPQSQDLADLFVDRFRTPAGYADLLGHIAALDPCYTASVSASLGSLGLPFSVAWGARDAFQPIRNGERLAADAGLPSITTIRDASHFSPADAPDEVAEAIREHLASAARRRRAKSDQA